MSDLKSHLQHGLQQMGIALSVPQQLQLLAFVELLKKWNSVSPQAYWLAGQDYMTRAMWNPPLPVSASAMW